MRLTPLGCSPSWPNAGGAGSGYLVEHDGTAVLLDCGSGVLAKLRRRCDYMGVDAVVITHLHADHVLDLVPYAAALSYSPRALAGQAPRPRLIAPPGAADAFARLASAVGMSHDLIAGAFALEEYDAHACLGVGPCGLAFREVPHYVRTFAVAVAAGGRRLVFGADCAPSAALVELARDADLLLVEATLAEPEDGEPRGHMTAREAGELGRRAGARRVVLTHVSDELDHLRVRSEGTAGYGAPVELAREGVALTV